MVCIKDEEHIEKQLEYFCSCINYTMSTHLLNTYWNVVEVRRWRLT